MILPNSSKGTGSNDIMRKERERPSALVFTAFLPSLLGA